MTVARVMGDNTMRAILSAFVALLMFAALPAAAGEADIKAAQSVIDSQLRAFQSGDDALAYSFAAPNVTAIFPTLESFMGMVAGGYQPVHKPKSFAFGKSQEMGPGKVAQQVMLVGPDGKDYEALYTLQLQPDGTWKITGVSLRASNSLST